jgi:lysylphosphatidylglycerol synthetase-like protein (DUF2156 family)
MSNITTLSIITSEPDKRLEALKKSRLSTIIQDPALFNRICEAAVILLNSEKLRAAGIGKVLANRFVLTYSPVCGILTGVFFE